MFRTGAQLFILTAIVGLLLMRESVREPLLRVEEGYADFLAMNAQRREPPPGITLVRIDETNLREHRWPWSPLDFALFFQSANGFRPEVLATDEVFSWELSGKNAQYAQILREHVLKAPRVLLGARLGWPEDPDKLPPLESTQVLRKVSGDLERVPEFTIIEAQSSDEFRLSSTSGFTNLPGPDNWHRSVPLVLRYRGQLVPTFVLQAVLLWEKAALDDVTVALGSHIAIGDRLSIPINAAGQMRVDFGAGRDHCGLDDLVLAAEQRDAQSDPRLPTQFFAGRFLLLSRTDVAATTMRLARGRPGSRGELFAAAIATIQGRSFIQRAPWWSDLVIIGFFALMSYWVPRWSRGMTAFVGLAILPAYTLVALGLFGAKLTWISAVIPAGQILFLILYRLVSPNIDRWAVPPKR
ncbi:MAG: CHASE2 domain-containing protein [Chthoniobacteraceae bacterium]